MQPYLKRIAELHFKRRNKQPLSDIETKEWIESLDLISKKKLSPSAAEHVLNYLWNKYRDIGCLCEVERGLWSWALDKIFDQYYRLCKLRSMAAIADETGDYRWFKELQDQIKLIEEVR